MSPLSFQDKNSTKVLKVENTFFLENLYPPFEILESLNTILYRNVIVYGAQGKGKTSFTNWLALKAKERYSEERVHVARQHSGLRILLRLGIAPRKPIQILIADDLSLVRISDYDLRNFYRLRHLLRDKGIKIGLGMTVLVIHDFFVIPRHLRSYFDALVFCSPPTNRYDRSFAKSYMGEEALDFLTYLHAKGTHTLAHLSKKVFWYLGKVALLETEDVEEQATKIRGRRRAIW